MWWFPCFCWCFFCWGWWSCVCFFGGPGDSSRDRTLLIPDCWRSRFQPLIFGSRFFHPKKVTKGRTWYFKKMAPLFFVDFYGTLVGKYTSPMNPMWDCKKKGCLFFFCLVLKLLVDVLPFELEFFGLILWFVFCFYKSIWLVGGFKHVFLIFTPKLGGDDPTWRSYFSNGLVQPPTRWCFFSPQINTLGQLMGLDGISWLFQHPRRLWKDQIAPIWAAMSQEERHLV